MKKKLILGVILCAIICLSTSCARKIRGATPHRRDRNCGCEYLQAPCSSDSMFAYKGVVSHVPREISDRQ